MVFKALLVFLVTLANEVACGAAARELDIVCTRDHALLVDVITCFQTSHTWTDVPL